MKRKIKWKRWLIAAAVAVLVIAGALYTWYLNALSAVNERRQDVVFVVESGENMDSVLERLQEENLIKNSFLVSLHARISGLTQTWEGVFTLNDTMSADEILRRLNDADEAKTNQTLITFPEGSWAKDYAALIEENLGISAEELIAKWNDMEYIRTLAQDYAFLDADTLDNEDYRVRLEGYLFPETYAFDEDADADAVTRTFLDHFQEIYEKYAHDFEDSDMSIHELITLASIVQYEASTAEDMKTIAGVFYNRLQEGMPLQSTVTVCYALYDDLDRSDSESWKACEASTDIDSPYNTYLNEGLPIGPIVNPGEQAIEAVLHPDENDYLYFIADINGVKKLVYAIICCSIKADHGALLGSLSLLLVLRIVGIDRCLLGLHHAGASVDSGGSICRYGVSGICLQKSLGLSGLGKDISYNCCGHLHLV